MSGPRRITVVLCDDVAEVRQMLRIVLEMEGDFEVVAEAVNGMEAVERAGRHAPDLLVLDLYMPVMNGLQAIPGIRAASPDTRIVVLSGIEARQAAAEALERGAVDYVEKGTPVDEIVDALRRAAVSPPPRVERGETGGGAGPVQAIRIEPEPSPTAPEPPEDNKIDGATLP